MHLTTIKLITTIIFLIVIASSTGQTAEETKPSSSGVMGKIKSGIKLATKLLGLDRAASVAYLVTETFGGGGSKSKIKGDNIDEQNQNLFSGFFRLLGLDAGKLGAIAINGFIFLAQLISTSFKLKPHEKLTYARNSASTELPIEWFIKNKKLSSILENAKNNNLPDKIIEYVQEKASDEETLCIQLLICKSAPLIWGMQKTISKSLENISISNSRGAAPMFATLPTLEEVIDHGDKCEEKYPYCRYLE